jgi:hypothetical protein
MQESVLIVPPQGPPTRVAIDDPSDLQVQEWDLGGNAAGLPYVEVFLNGVPDKTPMDRAREMAVAVLQGDEEAALVLADYVLENFARQVAP